MQKLAPEIEKIKKSKKSKEEQARETFELYKQHKVNPFSGCLLVLIQIPIIFALYYVFLKGINFSGSLYSFIEVPPNINLNFLGLVDIGQKSLVLAIIAGVTQFFQAHFMPKAPESLSQNPTFAESLSKNMRVQMKYVFPFVVAFIAYGISGAVALYWATSNTFAIFQQIYFNKKAKDAEGRH